MDTQAILDYFQVERLEDVKKAHRQRVLLHHPDRGGNVATFIELQRHYEAFKQLTFAPNSVKPKRRELDKYQIFKDFLAQLETLGYFDPMQFPSHSLEEHDLLDEFESIAKDLGYIDANGRVRFLPCKLTLPRFYRMYALAYLDRESDEYLRIQAWYRNTLRFRP